MIFKVPLTKDLGFAGDLFTLLSNSISELALENQKLPNQVIFNGDLGLEVFNYIKEKDWNFKGFSLSYQAGPLNQIIFKYSSALTQVEGGDATIFENGSLNGKQVNGIPGPETIGKIMSVYSGTSFKIERTVRPEHRIKLIRL
jgi:hypothetical protein